MHTNIPQGQRKSYRVSKMQYAEIYPDRVPRQLSYIFKNQKPLEIPDRIAARIIEDIPAAKPYDQDMKELDIKDRFDVMPWPDLQKLAARYKISLETGTKKETVLKKVRDCHKQGKKPMPIDEYEQYMKERRQKQVREWQEKHKNQKKDETK